MIIRLETGETTILGAWCRMVYGVGWFPTVVIIRLETGKTTILGVGCRAGVGCRVVPHSCENKAISAPSWAWAWAWAELGKKWY